jgi:hypothetical protein
MPLGVEEVRIVRQQHAVVFDRVVSDDPIVGSGSDCATDVRGVVSRYRTVCGSTFSSQRTR